LSRPIKRLCGRFGGLLFLAMERDTGLSESLLMRMRHWSGLLIVAVLLISAVPLYAQHTPMVGAGKFGSEKLPMATGDVSRKAFTLPVNGGPACSDRNERSARCRFRPFRIQRRGLTGEGDLLAAKARLLLITAPVRRWHSRQWHIEMRDGSPSIVS
jgi:hypothetical protein